MKKRNKRLLFISLLSVACTACTIAGSVAVAEEAHEAGLSAPLAEKVSIGTVVQLPDYYVEVDGENVKAQANVITPNGTVYSGSKFTANEAGRYVVEYIAYGEVVNTEYCTAVIGAKDMFTVNALATIDGVANYAYCPDDDALKGVAINVQGGASITYAQEITMNTLTKDDLLLEAVIEPTTKGETDFKQVVVTLTDVEDDSVYFRVTLTDGHEDGGSPKFISYVNAAANGQTAGGYNYDNAQKGVHWQQKDIYGTSIFSSFRAELSNGMSEHSFKLYYDAAENALYTCRYGTTVMVADFNDPVVFRSTSWGGFKSGKAKLSISFIDVKDSGRIIVNEIAGLRLTADEIVDSVAPDLEIDLLGESKAPNALLGTEYTVFPYTTYDFFDSHVDVDVTVTHENILTGSKTSVSVQNGKFVTNKLGKYTIRYVASDYSGNETVKEHVFECIAQAEEIVLSGITEDFSATVFERIDIPSTNLVRAFGGNGDLKISLVALDPDGEEIAIENDSFLPEKIGAYQFVYTATDYYGQSASKTLTIDVLASDKTVFLNDIVLPDLLIAGFEYTLPQIYAKVSYGGEVVECQIDYIVNGEKLDETRTFVASGAMANIECRAYVGDAAVYQSIKKSVTVVDGKGGKDQAAYFYDKEGKVTVTETMESVDLTVATNASVVFANKLKGESFSLGVSYKAAEIAFSTMNITLCDAEKSTTTVTFKFELSKTGAMMSVPYGQSVEFPTAEGYFKLNFDCGSGIVSDANGLPVAYADKDDAGNDFNGFENGLYAKISFDGVRSESKVSFVSLNNQLLGFRSDYEEEIGDTEGPEIECLGEIAVKAKVGDNVTIYPGRAYDVLNQVDTITVRMQAPSGNIVLAETAADKELQVTVTEKGYYKVIYTAYDTAGQRSRVVRNVRVVDSVAPTLSVEFNDMTKSVGDTVNLPKVTVSDDSGKVYYDIFVAFPNSEMRLVLHYGNGEIKSYLSKSDDNYAASFKVSDTSFKVEMKGKYVLTVMAYDDDYNVTMQSFTITVR